MQNSLNIPIKAQSRNNLALFSLLSIIFIDALGFGIVFPIFSLILIENATHIFASNISLHARNFWFEVSIGIYCIFMFLNSPILGSLSDRYGRKKILILSMVGLAIGYISMAIAVQANSLFGILLGRIISGGTAGSYPIAQAGVVDISSEEKKSSRLGLVAMCNGIGFACGPILGGLLIDKHLWHTINYQMVFWLFTGLILIGLATLHFFYFDKFSGNPEQKINFATSFYNLRDAFLLESTRNLCSSFLLFMTGYCIFFAMLPIFLTERFHKSSEWIGYFLTYFAVIFSASLFLLMPKVTAKFSLFFIIVCSLYIQIIFSILFILNHSSLLLWFLIFPFASVVPMAYVALVTALSNNVDSQNQGKIMGIVGSLAALAWGIGPLFGGWLGKLYGSMPYFFTILLLLSAIFLMNKSSASNRRF